MKMPSVKKVLVIGGGYAGLAVAKTLDSDPNVDLTVVDAREGFLLHKFAALRASVRAGQHIDNILVPTKQSLKRGKIIRAKVVKVNDMDRTAILDDGNSIKFDIVVIATGARNLSPGEPPASISDMERTKQYYTDMASALEKANRIVVYGAGLVGIELCGEIISKYPEKKLVLINGNQHQLAGKTALTPSQIKSVTAMITKSKMKYINNDDVVATQIPKENLADASPLVEIPDGKLKLTSGRMIDADLLILCFGGRLSTFGMYPNGWLSIQTGELKINQETFQVDKCDFAFALGDVADTAHEKLGIEHVSDAAVVAANVKALAQGKKVTRKASNKRQGLIISFGDAKGRSFLNYLPTLGNYFTRSLKSGDLYVKYIWNLYAGGLKPKDSKTSGIENIIQDYALEEKKKSEEGEAAPTAIPVS